VATLVPNTPENNEAAMKTAPSSITEKRKKSGVTDCVGVNAMSSFKTRMARNTVRGKPVSSALLRIRAIPENETCSGESRTF
jgi:hypothetical protein